MFYAVVLGRKAHGSRKCGGNTASITEREKKSQAGCPIVSSTSRKCPLWKILSRGSASSGPSLSQKAVPPSFISLGLHYPGHCAIIVGVVWISLGPSLASNLAPVLLTSCSLRSCLIAATRSLPCQSIAQLQGALLLSVECVPISHFPEASHEARRPLCQIARPQ